MQEGAVYTFNRFHAIAASYFLQEAIGCKKS